MKKFINKTDDFIIDSLKGFANAHNNLVTLNLNPIFVTRKEINPNKVLLVSGGGSGHEPLHTGYIGKGMLDKQDLGGTLLYLLSNMSQYLNGQNIVIDDGFSL